MKTNFRNSKHSSNVNNVINSIERSYIEKNLQYFIQKEAACNRKVLSNLGWIIESDYNTRLRTILLDYILDHFTLWDLYIIFFENQSCYFFSAGNIKDSKQNAIENINSYDTLTIQERKRLKRKVWDMNPILFGHIHEFIHQSDLFWNDEKEEIVCPDLEKAYAID